MENNSNHLIEVLGGFIMTVFSMVTGWLHLRVNRLEDKKVSKDVFNEFKESNKSDHERQDKKLDQIFDKLDDKQDKKK